MATPNRPSSPRHTRGREVQQRTLAERIDRATQRGLRATWRLLVAFGSALGHLWRTVQVAGASLARGIRTTALAFCHSIVWTAYHLIWPAALYIGICIGVALSALLPASLWAHLAVPQLVAWTDFPTHSFPLAQLPDRSGWLPILIAALGIAAVVFHEGGFDELQGLRRPLLATLIAAVALGMRWHRVLIRRRPCPEPAPPI